MSGDAPDFEAYVRDTRTAFYRRARGKTGDRHLAEDAVQTVYMKMYRNWPKVSASPGSLTGYGHATLGTVLIDQHRKTQDVVVRHPDELPEGISTIGIPDDAYQLLREDVAQWLEELPERQRTIITMHYIDDLTMGQIGNILTLKPETVSRYLRAGLKQLQKQLQNKEVTA
jgi:RNA polymerase sigma factor (sigma-70 family)